MEYDTIFRQLLEIDADDNTKTMKDHEDTPFADSNNFLKDVVKFISIELIDKTRVYQWFSPNATLGDLFQFVSSRLQDVNTNYSNRESPVSYDFYLQDKEIKNDNRNIRFTKENQSKMLRDCLSPINPGSTRNRYSLKVILS